MWARNHEHCVRCGKTDFKHVARGVCNSCYQKEYKSDPARNAKIEAQKLAWYHRYHDENMRKMKLHREQLHFSGKRDQVIRRDKKCVRCGSRELLVVHHKDHAGRGHLHPDNRLSNLETLCRKCHINLHRSELRAARKTRANGFWSKTFDCCVSCGTTKKRHNGHGLCVTCYARQKI